MTSVNYSMFFVTGTDTGVGKTMLTGLLTRYLRNTGFRAVALKPICSGGRADARRLRAAANQALTLDEINPWHFRAALAPLVGARQAKRLLRPGRVLAHVRGMRKRFQLVLVEGAGGLLSPLGEDFCARDLIRALEATPIVVCPNRLGAINQVLLVLAALPPGLSRRAQVALVSPARTGAASRSNARILAEKLGRRRVHVLPWLKHPARFGRALATRRIRLPIRSLVRSLGLPTPG